MAGSCRRGGTSGREGAWGLVAGFDARSPRVLRTIAQRDLVLICVDVEIDDEEPRAAADADEVRLTHPDRALTPEDWPARTLVEDLLAD